MAASRSDEGAKALKYIPLLGGVFNVVGGLVLVFLFRPVIQALGMSPIGHELWILFSGGTAVTFGAAYIRVFQRPTENLNLLKFGTGLKIWAFVIGLYCFLLGILPLMVFILFGVSNLALALLFMLFIRRQATIKAEA